MKTKDWHVSISKNDDGTDLIFVEGKSLDDQVHITVCTMGSLSDGEAWSGYNGEHEDAKLIAAAPAMLAELKRIVGMRRSKALLDDRNLDEAAKIVEALS